MIATLRMLFAAFVLIIVTLVLAPLQRLAIALEWRLAELLPVVWHRIACRVIGIRVHIVGEPCRKRPLLIASSHQSWSDIMVLGKVMPLAFIAKSEVADWPVFGLLAKLQRTVFVERAARGRTGEQTNSIAGRLLAGDAMVLFAEGTTSDGNEVLPFKTALFGAAQAAIVSSGAETVAVQPVAIAYTHASGLPLGRSGRPFAAWPGDVELMPHLTAVLREGAVDVEISFGSPIPFTRASDRKAVARDCQADVARMLTASLRGHNRRAIAPGDAAESLSALAQRHDGVDIGT